MSTVVFHGGPADGRVEFKENDPPVLIFTGFVKTKDGPFFDDKEWKSTMVEYRRTKVLNEHGELIYKFFKEY